MARNRSDDERKAIFAKMSSGSRKLSSDQLKLRTPAKSIVNLIKDQNLDNRGRFTHKNFRLGNKVEKIPLESVNIFNTKNDTYLLKGTSPSDKKTITKIISLK